MTEPVNETLGYSEGLQLIAENDELTIDAYSFTSKEKLMPTIGKVYITGAMDEPFADHTHMTVKGNDFVSSGKVNLFHQRMYLIHIDIVGLREPSKGGTFLCHLSLPGGNARITSELFFDHDKLNEDPIESRIAYTENIWKKEGSEEEYNFLMPGDPKALSKLRVSFSYSPSEENSEPSEV